MKNKPYDFVAKFRKNRKADIIKTMGGKCCVCGYDKCQSALDVYHIDKSKKQFQVSKTLNMKWERVAQELMGCVLVCANCHREIHAGETSAPVKSTFNKEIAEQIQNRINEEKTKHKFHCKLCGAEITKGATLCRDCNDGKKYKCEYPSDKDLKKMIHEQSYESIGRLLGVSGVAVKKHCIRRGLI